MCSMQKTLENGVFFSSPYKQEGWTWFAFASLMMTVNLPGHRLSMETYLWGYLYVGVSRKTQMKNELPSMWTAPSPRLSSKPEWAGWKQKSGNVSFYSLTSNMGTHGKPLNSFSTMPSMIMDDTLIAAIINFYFLPLFFSHIFVIGRRKHTLGSIFAVG